MSKHGFAVVTAVSCASPGTCAAAGRYSTTSYNPDGSGPDQIFVLNKTNGTWGTPHVVTATGATSGQVTGLACPAAGECSAGGYNYAGTQQRAFVISQSWRSPRPIPCHEHQPASARAPTGRLTASVSSTWPTWISPILCCSQAEARRLVWQPFGCTQHLTSSCYVRGHIGTLSGLLPP